MKASDSCKIRAIKDDETLIEMIHKESILSWKKNLDQIMRRLQMLILQQNTVQVATAVRYSTKYARIL